MKKDAARSIHTGRESAGFFHWADIMRKMDFIIFFKLMNVKRLRLWNQFVARDAVQVFEQLLFFLHAAAQAHAQR